MEVYGKYFCGNEVSDYGQKNGYVDYGTFAKAFDAVMANDFMQQTSEIGYWECESGGEYYEDTEGNTYTEEERDEKVEELEERLEKLEESLSEIEERMEECEDDKVFAELERDYEEIEKARDEIQDDIDELEYPKENEVFQWFIIDGNGADLCKEANEIVYYNETLDLYLWGVTHWGTSWSYVLTDIRCNTKGDN